MKKYIVLIIALIAICASIAAFALLSKEKEYEFDWDRFYDDIAMIKQQYYASSDEIKETVNLFWEIETIRAITYSFNSTDSVPNTTAYYYDGQRGSLEESPELYDAYMQCPDFVRNNGLHKSTTSEKSVHCYVGGSRYSNKADATSFTLYFGIIEDEESSFIIYSEQLDEDCWIVAETYGLE